MPGPIKLRAVSTGDSIVVAVEGGFARRQAPTDGLVVETPEQEFFLPVDKVRDALAVLDARREPPPKEQLSLPTRSRR